MNIDGWTQLRHHVTVLASCCLDFPQSHFYECMPYSCMIKHYKTQLELVFFMSRNAPSFSISNLNTNPRPWFEKILYLPLLLSHLSFVLNKYHQRETYLAEIDFLLVGPLFCLQESLLPLAVVSNGMASPFYWVRYTFNYFIR